MNKRELERKMIQSRVSRMSPDEKRRLATTAAALDGAKVATFVKDPAIPKGEMQLRDYRLHVHPEDIDERFAWAQAQGYVVRVEQLAGRN